MYYVFFYRKWTLCGIQLLFLINTIPMPYKISFEYVFISDLNTSYRLLYKMADASFEAEEHFDEYEHYNYDQDKAMLSGHSGK